VSANFTGGQKMTSLREIKERIIIVTRDAERSAKIKATLFEQDDCFGENYSEVAEPCKLCNVIVELDGHRDSMSGWCRKLTLQNEGVEPPESEMAPESELEQAVEISEIPPKILPELPEFGSEIPPEPEPRIIPIYCRGSGSGSGSKTDFGLRGHGGIERRIRDQLAAGVPIEQIKQEIYQLYIDAGRDEKYARQKARWWPSWVNNKIKKGIAASGAMVLREKEAKNIET
jgi:hypothetical protein